MASFYVHILPWTLVCKRKATKRNKTKRTETGYVLKWNETQRHDCQKRQTNATLITVLPNETERFWSRFFDAYCTFQNCEINCGIVFCFFNFRDDYTTCMIIGTSLSGRYEITLMIFRNFICKCNFSSPAATLQIFGVEDLFVQ